MTQDTRRPKLRATSVLRWPTTVFQTYFSKRVLIPWFCLATAMGLTVQAHANRAAQSTPAGSVCSPAQPAVIWFDEPLPTEGDEQRNWEQRALPIGNGALGAVIYGGVTTETLQLNEKTLWIGGPGADGGYNHGNWTDGRGPEAMAEVQDMISDSPTGGVAPEVVAELLGEEKLNYGAYQSLGELKLDMQGIGQTTAYRRALDIASSLATTTFVADGVTYTREYFASAPDQVVVVRLTSSAPGHIAFTARLEVPDGRSQVSNLAQGGRITTSGTLTNNGMRWESQVQVLTQGGTVFSQDNGAVTVQGADSALLVLSAATDYAMDYARGYRSGIDPHEPVTRTVSRAAALPYRRLLHRHQQDYRRLFDRVALDLGAELPDLPTDELLNNYRNGIQGPEARALEALYFQYGRYLLISSSRGGSLPANLQGVWSRLPWPAWSADYHVNINLQMNYWPAETTNLTETTAPFFDFVDSLVAPGSVTASTMYGARGWVIGNETNPFGYTGFHNWPTAFWQPDAAAWLAQHYWQHYLFTGDRAFLKERGYPMLKSVAQFWLDFLIADPNDGSLVVSPSYSPEQGDFTAGAAISQQIVAEHLQSTLAAATLAGEQDTDFLSSLQQATEHIDPGLRIGSWGQLQEWKVEQALDNPSNEHRHISHLYALFPGSAISTSATPALAEAAQVTLQGRGDGGTGWSKAWKINFWARLRDGDHAHKMLGELLSNSTLDNLWDDHPPFQIDGNFGAVSGIAEMLVQSHAGHIDILPALPGPWPAGAVSGLVARGGFEVDIEWHNGRVKTVYVTAKHDGPVHIRSDRWAAESIQVRAPKGRRVLTKRTDDLVRFQARAGTRYRLAPQ